MVDSYKALSAAARALVARQYALYNDELLTAFGRPVQAAPRAVARCCAYPVALIGAVVAE